MSEKNDRGRGGSRAAVGVEVELNADQDTRPLPAIQPLAAHWVANRFRLSIPLAATVARLAGLGGGTA